MRGGNDASKKATTAPVLNSSSFVLLLRLAHLGIQLTFPRLRHSDEETAFLQNFINDLEHADKAAAKH